ncbi:hypothetical protein IP88_01735 [alpha proteobacterium AAP81b]|nr:hypothetical protein IP88_01735 [alpha proteobacterium AAP81b]
MKAYLWVAVLAAAAASVPAFATNLVINGQFDQPAVGSGWNHFNAVPGWTSNTGDFIEIGHASVYGASCFTPGCQVLEVNANRFGSVSQVVTGLRVGSAYDFGWAFAGRSSGGPQRLDVLLDGEAVGVHRSNGFAGWLESSHRFVAKAAEARITFAARDVGGWRSYGNLVTDVQVAAVPEPNVWAMLITGFGMVGATLRRRRQAATA